MSASALPTATSVSSDKNIPITKQPLKTRGLQCNTQIWLKEMAARDMQLWGLDKPLWICDNKIYDLTEFAQKHPGGRNWIDMTKGHDITMSFKTHHLDEDRVRKILDKYYVGQARIKNESRFDFKETGHYDEIRKRILDKFSVAELQSRTKTDIICYTLVVVWLMLVTLSGYFNSYLLAIVCGFFISVFYGVGHIYIHRKDSMNILKHVYLIFGFSAREQRIMHCVSHHPYTNTGLDYEYAALQPIMNYARYLPQSKWYSTILIEILLALIAPFNALTKLVLIPVVNRQKPSFQHLAFFLLPCYIYFLTGNSGISLKLWLTMVITAGICFSKTIVCPHRQIQLWSEGAPEIRDYVLHSIITTTDSNHSNIPAILSFMLYLGFNIHVLHHLYPTIDHSKLYECNKIFVEYCKEKGLKISTLDLLTCNKNMYKLEVGRKEFDLKVFLTE